MSRVVEAPHQDVDKLTAAALSQLTGTTVLNCLGKQPAPLSLGADLAHVADLPQAVRDDFWTVLEPNLGAINTPHSNAIVGDYCTKHALDPTALTPVLGACRFLILRGVENNTPPDLLEEDVRQLLEKNETSDDDVNQTLALIIPLYQRAAPKLRMDAVYEALIDHGKVVNDIKWRVDHISHANTGEAINMPVTILTLRYNEGDNTGQITFQLLPDELKKLSEACEQALR